MPERCHFLHFSHIKWRANEMSNLCIYQSDKCMYCAHVNKRGKVRVLHFHFLFFIHFYLLFVRPLRDTNFLLASSSFSQIFRFFLSPLFLYSYSPSSDRDFNYSGTKIAEQRTLIKWFSDFEIWASKHMVEQGKSLILKEKSVTPKK